jgi:HEAT repeat protein
VALGKQQVEQAVEPLLACLESAIAGYHAAVTAEETAFVEAVIAALGEIGDQRAVAPLLDIHKSEEDYGIRFGASAYEALIMLGESAVEPLVASAQGEDTDYARQTIGMLGKIGGERAIEALAGYLDDPDLGYEAAMALGDTGDSGAVQYLIPCLSVNEGALTYRAAEALGKIGTSEAERALITALHNPDGDAETLRAAATALGSFKDRDAIDALIAVRTKVEYTHVVNIGTQVDNVLVSIGADAVEPLLSRLGEHDERNDRMWLIYILGEIKDTRAVAPLIAILQDKDDKYRGQAAQALGAIGDASAIPSLTDAMLHSYDDCGYSAARALGAIGNEQAVSVLLDALDNSPDVSRVDIATVISRVDDPRCASRLDTALETRDLPVIAGAVDYYIRLGREGSEEALIETLEDYYYFTAAALYTSGNQTLSEAASDWASDNGYTFKIVGFGPSIAWGSGN